MIITLYLRILTGDLEEWERKGWKFVRDVFPLGGWEQCLVKKDITGSTLGHGAAIERFDDEFKRVLENILDPNTADGPRSVSLKVTINPDELRSRADLSISVSSSVRGPKSVPTIIFMGKDRGQPVAFEHNPEQLKLKLTGNTPVIKVAGDPGGKEK